MFTFEYTYSQPSRMSQNYRHSEFTPCISGPRMLPFSHSRHGSPGYKQIHNQAILRARNWKRSFISTVFHNENELLENTLWTGGIWKGRLCVLVWTENILKTELYENDLVIIIMWFPRPRFPQTNPKMTDNCCLFKFLRLSVQRKHFMCFQNKTSVFKFLRRRVDGASIIVCVNLDNTKFHDGWECKRHNYHSVAKGFFI